MAFHLFDLPTFAFNQSFDLKSFMTVARSPKSSHAAYSGAQTAETILRV